MKLKAVFSNEMPFMVQLPSGDYKVKVKYGINNEENELILSLTDEMYRLHLDSQPGKGSYVDGLVSKLNKYIKDNNLKTYAFTPLRSYVTCSTEKEITITEERAKGIREEDIKEKTIKPFLISEGIKNGRPINGEELNKKAAEIYTELSEEEKNDMRIEVVAKRELYKLTGIITHYHKALNTFIKQYRYVRNDFFVEPLTIHTLEGTFVQTYIDNNLYEQYKHAGKAPSIITHSQWMPDISPIELQELKNNLVSFYRINPSKELIITARNLLERGEYRSAVIEANAALEIAVAEKITEKMKENGDSTTVIDAYLARTETNFYQRCDYQLKAKTSFSFVTDNSTLWRVISAHRKTFRHKIAHTALTPPSNEVEGIIDDYERAIQWVESL
ncbi:hypothetical protein [Thalassobacillus pellis]|uniref:hypothetical protein n=1 Tax=Thalassobacillus pellis TaxID=748008 RepID=UPI0019604742|nr:hypothetical protein [Thalassobacillus pellis]MBM7554443.1 hypothetical protein [Thalassobacillus pellis]